MLDVEQLAQILRNPLEEGMAFRPYDVDLNRFFPTHIEEKEPGETLTLRSDAKISVEKIEPNLPKGSVVAIDTTSITLGHVKDGAVGAIRGAVIVREPNKKNLRVERYGPYLLAPTNQNKQAIYEKMRNTIVKMTK